LSLSNHYTGLCEDAIFLKEAIKNNKKLLHIFDCFDLKIMALFPEIPT